MVVTKSLTLVRFIWDSTDMHYKASTFFSFSFFVPLFFTFLGTRTLK
jgi:hypothetical protein